MANLEDDDDNFDAEDDYDFNTEDHDEEGEYDE